MDGRCDQPALAQGDGEGDVDLLADHVLVVLPEAVQLGHFGERHGDCFDQHDCQQQAVFDGAFDVFFLQPAQGFGHVDARLQVVMRNFAVGARHCQGDRLTHGGLEVGWLLRLRRRCRRWERGRLRGWRCAVMGLPMVELRAVGLRVQQQERVPAQLVHALAALAARSMSDPLDSPARTCPLDGAYVHVKFCSNLARQR